MKRSFFLYLMLIVLANCRNEIFAGVFDLKKKREKSYKIDPDERVVSFVVQNNGDIYFLFKRFYKLFLDKYEYATDKVTRELELHCQRSGNIFLNEKQRLLVIDLDHSELLFYKLNDCKKLIKKYNIKTYPRLIFSSKFNFFAYSTLNFDYTRGKFFLCKLTENVSKMYGVEVTGKNVRYCYDFSPDEKILALAYTKQDTVLEFIELATGRLFKTMHFRGMQLIGVKFLNRESLTLLFNGRDSYLELVNLKNNFCRRRIKVNLNSVQIYPSFDAKIICVCRFDTFKREGGSMSFFSIDRELFYSYKTFSSEYSISSSKGYIVFLHETDGKCVFEIFQMPDIMWKKKKKVKSFVLDSLSYLWR